MGNFSLFDSQSIAHYDYLSGIIRLNGLDSNMKDCLTKLLTKSASNIQSQYHLNCYCVMLHEIVHFIDLSTTLWGLEFHLRKMRLLEEDISPLELKKRAEVYMLNFTEISMHEDLIEINQNEQCNILTSVMKHAYDEHENYGYICKIYFYNGSNLYCSAPISMLSNLEASAYATELLVKFKKYDKNLYEKKD